MVQAIAIAPHAPLYYATGWTHLIQLSYFIHYLDINFPMISSTLTIGTCYDNIIFGLIFCHFSIPLFCYTQEVVVLQCARGESMFFITTDGRRFICFSLTLLYDAFLQFVVRRGFDRINNINKVIGEGRNEKLLVCFC